MKSPATQEARPRLIDDRVENEVQPDTLAHELLQLPPQGASGKPSWLPYSFAWRRWKASTVRWPQTRAGLFWPPAEAGVHMGGDHAHPDADLGLGHRPIHPSRYAVGGGSHVNQLAFIPARGIDPW